MSETLNAGRMASKLRELRGNRTQEDIAQAVGISRSAYMMYENGERIPRDYIKKKLADFYNVSVGSLFFDEK